MFSPPCRTIILSVTAHGCGESSKTWVSPHGIYCHLTRVPPGPTCFSLSLSPGFPLNPFQPWFTFHGVFSGKARGMRAQCRVSIQAGYEIAKVP